MCWLLLLFFSAKKCVRLPRYCWTQFDTRHEHSVAWISNEWNSRCNWKKKPGPNVKTVPYFIPTFIRFPILIEKFGSLQLSRAWKPTTSETIICINKSIVSIVDHFIQISQSDRFFCCRNSFGRIIAIVHSLYWALYYHWSKISKSSNRKKSYAVQIFWIFLISFTRRGFQCSLRVSLPLPIVSYCIFVVNCRFYFVRSNICLHVWIFISGKRHSYHS